MGTRKSAPAPWDSFKKDAELDHKVKRNREHLKNKRDQRRHSQGASLGDAALLHISQHYSAVRAASSGEIKTMPVHCEVVRTNMAHEKPKPSKNKAFAELSLKQQLDILKKKEDRRRAAITATEEEGEEEEKEGAHRGGQGETEEEEGGKMEERVNLRKTAVGKAREQQLEETQKRKEGQSTRHPVRLKLDEISDDYTYVSFGHMVPRYKHDAINRLDQAIATWKMKE